MVNRDFDAWLNKFRPSISTYDYYVDFEKVHKNVQEVKVELNILNDNQVKFQSRIFPLFSDLLTYLNLYSLLQIVFEIVII